MTAGRRQEGTVAGHSPIKRMGVRLMGRIAPSALRFLAHHNPMSRGRWPMLSALRDDARCREWLAGLENPTRTRQGFRIFTLPGDLTSDWIKLHGQHETGTERFILDHLRPGCAFIDVGANIGYFALLAAVVGKSRVVAFEPQRQVAELLLKSVEHNRVGDLVRVERLALSDAPGEMRMTECPGNTGHSSLVGADAEGTQPYLVRAVVLDEWLGENPAGPVSVCKIDTEGTEFQILRGMARLLDRDSPAIVVEVADELLARYGSSSADVMGLLGRHGYSDVTEDYASPGDRNRYLSKDAEPWTHSA